MSSCHVPMSHIIEIEDIIKKKTIQSVCPPTYDTFVTLVWLHWAKPSQKYYIIPTGNCKISWLDEHLQIWPEQMWHRIKFIKGKYIY